MPINTVYDPEQEETTKKPAADGSHDDLGVSPEQRDRETNDLENLLKAESAPRSDEHDRAAENESEKLDDTVGEGFTNDKNSKGRGKLRLTKRSLAVVLIAGVMGGGTLGFMSAVMPALKLESYLSRINNRVSAIASEAVEARMQVLLQKYLLNHFTGLDNCGRTVSINCRAQYDKGIASNLFRQWQDTKIEEKLMDKYKLSVTTDNTSPQKKYILTDPYDRKIELSDASIRSGNNLLGKNGLGVEMRDFLKKETKWYQVMERSSIRKYLKRKHGIKVWCFFACKTRDDIELRKTDIKTRFKYFLTKRMVYPFSGRLGFIMDCFIGKGSGCDAEGLRSRHIDRTPDADFMKSVEKLVKDNPGKKLGKIILDKIIDKVFKTTVTKGYATAASNAAPIVGQIYTAVVMTDMLDRIDEQIKNGAVEKFMADLHYRQYLEFYTMMRSSGDELKSHDMSLEEAGAIMKSLEGAESSLVYQAYNRQDGKIYRDPEYKCPSGDPIPDDEYVCPEYKLRKNPTWLTRFRNNMAVDAIADILNSYGRCLVTEIAGRCPQGEPRKYIRPVLGWIDTGISYLTDGILGELMERLMWLVDHTPGLKGFIDLVEAKAYELFNTILTKLFPLPVTVDSKGRELYDGMEAGGDITLNEFSKGGYTEEGESYGLGAQQIDEEVTYQIMQEYYREEAEEYAQASLAHKLTDLSYDRSFMNQLIEKTPSNGPETITTIARSVPTLFGNIINSFFMHNSVFAERDARQLAINAFGVTRYGYRPNDPIFSKDPEEFTEEYCEEAKKAWKESEYEDEQTGFLEYKVTNPCMLEAIVTETGKAVFTKDDDGGTN